MIRVLPLTPWTNAAVSLAMVNVERVVPFHLTKAEKDGNVDEPTTSISTPYRMANACVIPEKFSTLVDPEANIAMGEAGDCSVVRGVGTASFGPLEY